MKNKITTLRFSKDECPSTQFMGESRLMEMAEKIEINHCKADGVSCEDCYKLTREKMLKEYK